jgi:ABC-type protease/lipase transport system fused ATPase/permease subunit
LRGISFNLEAGNSLAIIGPSGAGKSTLARLIAGVWKPSAGEIRLDAVDLSTWNRADLGQHVGYLPQDVQLLSGTVAENISRFEANPSSEAVISAAQSAGVHELILRLPSGYDTPIGTGGVQLSGGQQQRLGLARALYGDPRLIILDEPNSNLDPEGEAALVEALHASRRARRTVVVVSHRAALLRATDWIIVLRDGRIERAGARGEVMRTLGESTTPPADLPSNLQAVRDSR